MNADQQTENLRMLAVVLGIADDEAASLLQASIQVTWLPADQAGAWLGEFTIALLERTFISVGTPSVPEQQAHYELLINSATPLVGNACVLHAVISQRDFHCGLGMACGESPVQAGPVPRVLTLLCACFASAQLAHYTLALPAGRVTDEGVYIDFARWPGVSTQLWERCANLGVFHLAGAGAVGNSFLYALRLLSVQGTLNIVDPKLVTGGIVNRCLWFEDGDIDESKAENLARKVQAALPQMVVKGFKGTIQQFRQGLNGEYGCLIVGVDSRRARRQLQEEMPFEVFDASTTGIEEVVFHHNQQLSGRACLGCIYRETEGEHSFAEHVAQSLNVSLAEVSQGYISPAAAARIVERYPQLDAVHIVGLAFDSLFKSLCATQQLTTAEQKQVLAPFAFVSQLAGTVQAIEFFLRRLDPARGELFNYWRVNPWRGVFNDLQQMRDALPNCQVCASPSYQTLAHELWISKVCTR